MAESRHMYLPAALTWHQRPAAAGPQVIRKLLSDPAIFPAGTAPLLAGPDVALQRHAPIEAAWAGQVPAHRNDWSRISLPCAPREAHLESAVRASCKRTEAGGQNDRVEEQESSQSLLRVSSEEGTRLRVSSESPQRREHDSESPQSLLRGGNKEGGAQTAQRWEQ